MSRYVIEVDDEKIKEQANEILSQIFNEEMTRAACSERQSSKVAGNWFNKGGKDRQKNRAKTFQGIADAMAEQCG